MSSYVYKTPLLCNNMCWFCVTNALFTNKTQYLDIKKVIKDFIIIKSKGYIYVSIQWWEPTIFKNFVDLIKVWKKLWLKVCIHTNWTFDYNNLLIYKKAWVYQISYSLHWHIWKIHDYQVWRLGAFELITKNIIESLKLWIKTSIISVISKYNQNHINDIINFINNNFKWLEFIAFCNMEANYLNNEDYIKKQRFFPDLSIIKKQISKINSNNIKIDNLPLCIFWNKLYLAEKNSMNFSDYKIKLDICKNCNLKNKCWWIFPYFQKDYNLIKPYE